MPSFSIAVFGAESVGLTENAVVNLGDLADRSLVERNKALGLVARFVDVFPDIRITGSYLGFGGYDFSAVGILIYDFRAATAFPRHEDPEDNFYKLLKSEELPNLYDLSLVFDHLDEYFFSAQFTTPQEDIKLQPSRVYIEYASSSQKAEEITKQFFKTHLPKTSLFINDNLV